MDEPGETYICNVDPRKAWTVRVVNTEPEEDIGGEKDWFKFELVSDDGKVSVSRKFVSTYGKFHIDLIDLTGDGQEEVVFVTGSGAGTSVREESLEVMQRRGNTLVPILKTKLSDYWTEGCRWWYAIEYVDLNGDGVTDLRLVLTHDQIEWDDLHWGNPKNIPSAAIKEYRWDPGERRMVLFRKVPRKAIHPPAKPGLR